MKNLTERHVQAVWYDAAFRPRELATRCGTRVRVLCPGEWNLGAGPDFTNAVLLLGEEERRLTGDVEVHLCPADWDFHGHGADPRYRNVVAHVTWGDGREPTTLPPGAVSIWLGRFMENQPGFSPEQIDLTAYPYARLPLEGRPCESRIGHDPDKARQTLADAGRHRLRMKARRLAGRLSEGVLRGISRRQIFYEEVMTALGYSKNAAQFRQVARRLPIDALPTSPEAARTAMLSVGTFAEWDRAGLRPNNSPERRLVAAAELFTSTGLMDFVDAGDFSRDVCRQMVRTMCRAGSLGPGRAAAVLANVIAPFALAEDRLSDLPDWLPPEDLSSPARLMAFRLFGRDHNPAALYSGNGLLIQGLLQIRRDHCLRHHPDCGDCELGK